MKQFQYLTLFFCSLLIFSITSCKKNAGEGGQSSITGKIWVKKYDASFTTIIGEYVGAYVDVYIIYGNDDIYGNKITTNPEGEFEFKYLRSGSYTIYAYAKDISPAGKTAIQTTVEILKKKQRIDSGTLTISNY